MRSTRIGQPFTAFLGCLRAASRAPTLVIGLYLLVGAASVPFALVTHERLLVVLGPKEMISPSAYRVDLADWRVLERRTPGLRSTLQPFIFGVAAPLAHLGDLFDAQSPALVAVIAAGLFGLAWLFLLGGILERFGAGARIVSPRDSANTSAVADGRRPETRLASDAVNPRRSTASRPLFLAGCKRHFPTFIALALISLSLYAMLGLLVQRLILNVFYEQLALRTTERAAFAIRFAIYAVFGTMILAVRLVVAYSRVHRVLEPRLTLRGVVLSGLRFVRAHGVAAGLLAALNGIVLAGLLAAYGLYERGTGGVALDNRALLVGQLFVASRVFMMLASTAANVRLVAAVRRSGAG